MPATFIWFHLWSGYIRLVRPEKEESRQVEEKRRLVYKAW